jgi:hypothetical protein
MGILEDLKKIDRLIAEVEPVEITFIGFCGKKNRKAPRKGGHGLYLEPRTRDIINRMELQVPPEARDLMLDNPEIDWYITYTNGHADADGIISTCLDILQKYRVIVNDNLVHLGNRQTIHPAVRGEQDSVRIVLTPSATLDKGDEHHEKRRR